MSVLITGGSGFLGKALTPLLLARGERVYSLSRHPPQEKEGLIPLQGDITDLNLGIEFEMPKIDALYHLAAIHRLGPDTDGAIWDTNVNGTINVVNFCVRHSIPKLYFVSTAYTQGRNPYERSKALCETIVKEGDIPHITIFKPSIVMGTPQHFYPGHVSQFISIVIKLHQRGEMVRRSIEGTLHLPIIEPVFRLRANPDGKLNLIPIDVVVEWMAKIQAPGTYWLTNPNPPTIGQLLEWIGEFIMVKIQIVPDFKPTPIEAMFEKLSSAFTPYLWGDDFPSDLPACHITREFIQQTIIKTILS